MASRVEGLPPADSPPFSDPSLAADLRAQDRDRWVSTLFAPAHHRDALVALYAFNLEIARVRDIVSDPLPGEMRFQWWRDLLSGQARGDFGSHPVAAALLRAMARYNLPAEALSTLIEARTFDLYEDPMPSLNDLEGYCGETSSIIIRLATFILADGVDPGGADLVGHAGVAFALTGLLRAMPFHASRGQVFLPADMMQAHGVTRDDMLSARDTPGLRSLLAELRARAPPPGGDPARHRQHRPGARAGASARLPRRTLPAADGGDRLRAVSHAGLPARLARHLDRLARRSTRALRVRFKRRRYDLRRFPRAMPPSPRGRGP